MVPKSPYRDYNVNRYFIYRDGKMDVIKISNTKLLLHLTKEETRSFEVTDESDEKLLSALYGILKKVGAEDVFIGGFPLSVKLFQSKDGGCEMFVSKLEDGVLLPYCDTSCDNSRIYGFKTLADTVFACKALRGTAESESGLIYKDIEGDGYYIKITFQFPNAVDFGGRELKRICASYITEHTKLLRGATIEKFANL